MAKIKTTVRFSIEQMQSVKELAPIVGEDQSTFIRAAVQRMIDQVKVQQGDGIYISKQERKFVKLAREYTKVEGIDPAKFYADLIFGLENDAITINKSKSDKPKGI